MSKRLITKKQEEIFKLCHHDFEGLSQTEAAERLGITQSAVLQALACVEKVLPQFFPILTKQEAQIYHYYMAEGWEVDEISEYTGLTHNAVYLSNGGVISSHPLAPSVGFS